ncbi:META domain-containing protein [Crenobacter luteus]|uniref:META domain-containing protein n=1 Tax=Crenobacter luteus TaxID=1452487 RepID=UPI00104F2028|nr:META domain-containing protein [Crenobacter luteus]
MDESSDFLCATPTLASLDIRRPGRAASVAKGGRMSRPLAWRLVAPLALCATLSACATGDAAVTLRAHGNEPFWSLEIDRVLRFSELGGRPLEGAVPKARTLDGVRRYTATVGGRLLEVAAAPRVCHDDMSGMPYPLAVSVAVDGRRLQGCGGDPAVLLRGAEWVVEDIDGGGIVDRSRVTLNFRADGRLDGRASCNRYTASYALSGEGLSVGRAASTLMACVPALMHQERRFLDVLQGVNRFEIGETGELRLIDASGRRIVARR